MGSLLIGLVIGYAVKSTSLSETNMLLIATGFCGGFTTFSAFTLENHAFLKNGDYMSFVIYTIGSIILGLLAVFAGFYLSKLI
jgi:CrcB protein